MPKVSVIVPIYNVENYLRECLDSIINQTLNDIEIILIDDGSKDRCPQIIDEYAFIDGRIKVVHKENKGLGSSYNLGLEMASGDYIGFVEPDDYIDFNMYEDLYNIALEKNVDIVKSSFYEKYDTPINKSIKEINWNKNYNLPQDIFNIKDCPLFLYFHPSIWTCIYKREFLIKNNIKFVEALSAAWTDNPFQVQTMVLADKIFYTDKPYYYWRKQFDEESLALKDIKIPLERSKEIHHWLEEYNVDNVDILSCIYKRELVYIDLILRRASFINRKDAYNISRQLLNLMSPDIIYNNKYFSKKECKKYKQLIKHIDQRYFYLKYKIFEGYFWDNFIAKFVLVKNR